MLVWREEGVIFFDTKSATQAVEGTKSLDVEGSVHYDVGIMPVEELDGRQPWTGLGSMACSC